MNRYQLSQFELVWPDNLTTSKLFHVAMANCAAFISLHMGMGDMRLLFIVGFFCTVIRLSFPFQFRCKYDS